MTPTLLELPPHVTTLVQRIVDRFQPEKVILFGSHVTGTANEHSDIDLLVVMETELSTFKQTVAIYRALDHRPPTDLIVRTPAQIANRNPRDIILRTILQEGVTVYEARN